MSQTGSYVTSLVWETTDAEGPTRAEYQTNWNAMDGHSHDNRGAGRGIRGIQTTSAPTQTGDMQINGDALQWWGATSAAVITAVNPNVAVSSLLFSGPAGVATTRFVGILSASGAPVAGTWLQWDYGYDEAGNIWLCTVAGSPGTWIKAGGPALPLTVANGGTGLATLTNHGVLTGAGTGNVASTAEGATNTVLHGNTGAVPTYSAVTGSDIAAGTITASNIASGTITPTQLANPVVRAQVKWNTPTSITSQFNVASITKNGTGDYTVNFASSIPGGCVASAIVQGAGASANIAVVGSPGTASCEVFFANGSGNPVDPGAAHLLCFG